MEQLETPQVLPMTFCNQGLKNTIPVAPTGTERASLSEGFPAVTSIPSTKGGIPPDRADFNGAMNLNSQFYFAFQNGWLPTFNQEVSDAIGGYALNAILWLFDTENNKVRPLRSLIGNNTYNFNTDKSYIGKYWAELVTDGQGIPVGCMYLSQSQKKADNLGALPLFTGEIIENFSLVYPVFNTYLKAHPELCKTEEEYNTFMSTYGECEFYVLNETENTLRLPLVKNYIKFATLPEGLTQKKAGLPNITGKANIGGMGSSPIAISSAEGALKTYKSTNYMTRGENAGPGPTGLELDASLSSDVYGGDETVTPAHTTWYPWVIVYHAEQTDSTQQVAEILEAGEEQIQAVENAGQTQASALATQGENIIAQAQAAADEAQQAVTGKADVSLSNTVPSQSFKEAAVSWVMPDYSAATNLTSFTADRDYLGYIRTNEHQYTVTIDGQEVARFMPGPGYIPNVSTTILIPKDSDVVVTGSAGVMVKFPLIGG